MVALSGDVDISRDEFSQLVNYVCISLIWLSAGLYVYAVVYDFRLKGKQQRMCFSRLRSQPSKLCLRTFSRETTCVRQYRRLRASPELPTDIAVGIDPVIPGHCSLNYACQESPTTSCRPTLTVLQQGISYSLQVSSCSYWPKPKPGMFT